MPASERYDDRSYGEIAYQAYGDARAWKTVTGTRMPAWREADQSIQIGWTNAAYAAIAAYRERAARAHG